MKNLPSCQSDNQKLVLDMQVSIPCNVDAIESVIRGVMEAIRKTNCVPESEFEVDSALREALANAVVHGCKKDNGKMVQLCVACDESEGMLIVIRDPGSGFDPNAIPSPVLGQNIYSSHGHGVFLINQLMDEARFARGGTEIRMRKM